MLQSMMKLIEVMEGNKDLYHLLQSCPYSILREMELKTYPSGTFELKQGEIYQDFFIIVSGQADIFTVSDQGKKYFQTTYSSGDVIGEMEIFQGHPYLSYVQARKEITVLVVNRALFLRWIQIDQQFNQLFIEKLCRTSYEMFARMGQQQLYSLKERICQYLLDHPCHPKDTELSIHTEDLAQKMAVTQRSVSRILKELKEQEILSLSRGKIHILNRAALVDIIKEKEKV